MSDKSAFRSRLLNKLKDALEADEWGQSIEAGSEYEELDSYIKMEKDSDVRYTQFEEMVLDKIRAVLQGRINCIEPDSDENNVKVEHMKVLMDYVDKNLFRSNNPFPTKIDFGSATSGGGSGGMDFAGDDDIEPESRSDAPRDAGYGFGGDGGGRGMTIYIDKIGLKDAQNYFDAGITISVVASGGKGSTRTIESHEMKANNKKPVKPNYVPFEQEIRIETSFREFEQNDYTLFFEFKHYKPKAKKISTRCFALMEVDEVDKHDNQPSCLELYKKPTDFSKKRLNLFTIKKLYLHLTVATGN